MINLKYLEPLCCSNHIIRIDKYAMMCVIGITIFMPTYMFILHQLLENPQALDFWSSCNWFVFNLAMTFTMSFSLMIINVYALHFLEANYPWRTKWQIHLPLEIIAILIYAPLVAILVHLLFIPFRVKDEGSLWVDIFKSELYAVIFNFAIVAVYEGAYLFKQWKTALIETERLQKENILSQFETLRTQINPHFLFNSLNTLVGIVQTNPEQAVLFIKEFSKVYRNVLNHKDSLLITLEEELKLINSFVFLQKIRFGDNLKVDIQIDNGKMHFLLPPFSLQLLIENALKHNIVSSKKPLTIHIKNEKDYLVVSNNLQKRLNEDENSTGIGLKNLKTRYEMISLIEPEFVQTEAEYIAKIPLIRD
jgi:two-component system, LytTR family, sensor kinase